MQQLAHQSPGQSRGRTWQSELFSPANKESCVQGGQMPERGSDWDEDRGWNPPLGMLVERSVAFSAFTPHTNMHMFTCFTCLFIRIRGSGTMHLKAEFPRISGNGYDTLIKHLQFVATTQQTERSVHSVRQCVCWCVYVCVLSRAIPPSHKAASNRLSQPLKRSVKDIERYQEIYAISHMSNYISSRGHGRWWQTVARMASC